MPTRTDAFVSYSHVDQVWLERVKVHLKPLFRASGINVWEDTKLRSGQRWRQEIDKALDKAKVAILLVSPDFLASDFVQDNELPPLLEAAQREGVTILPVIVSSCSFRRSALSEFQAVNSPDKALDILSPGEVNRVLTKLADRVHELMVAEQPTPPAAVPVAKPKPKPQPAPTVAALAPTPSRRRQPEAKPAKPLALLVGSGGSWETVEVRTSRIDNGTELHLTLQPTTPVKRMFLLNLNKGHGLSSVVFNEQLYLCNMRSLSSQTEGDKTEIWQLKADIRERPEGMDYTFNGQTPAKRAQLQASLLLLNERPPVDTNQHYGLQHWVSDESVSHLFSLYHYLGQNKAAFERIAPLVATWYLQMGNIVHHIHRLAIQVKGTKMTVDFEGQRQSAYRNEPPSTITVKGQCQLPPSLPADSIDVRLKK